MASSLFLNSGEKVFSTAFRPLSVMFVEFFSPKPRLDCAISRTPAFEVMIKITFLKSAFRPVLSVKVP